MSNLDELPFPGYHFTMMAGAEARYGMIEASRGCPHRCKFCSQRKHWQGTWRHKSVKRIVDAMEFCYRNYGSRLLWLTDDNFGVGERMNDLCDELINRGFSDDVTCFMQARCDDVVRSQSFLPKMCKAGINWLLLGVESHSKTTLENFKKGTNPEDAKVAVKLFKRKRDILSSYMHRRRTQRLSRIDSQSQRVCQRP